MKKLLLLTLAIFSLITTAGSMKGAHEFDFIKAGIMCHRNCCNMANLTTPQRKELANEHMRRFVARTHFEYGDGYRDETLETPPIPQEFIPAAIHASYIAQVATDTQELEDYGKIRRTRELNKNHTFCVLMNSFIPAITAWIKFLERNAKPSPPHPSAKPSFAKWSTRLGNAFSGAAKTSYPVMLHSITQYFRTHSHPPIYFNGIKIFGLYLLLDMTHHYATDIAAKEFPSLTKYDNALRTRIKHYDTLKNKLGWLTKASIAAYQSHVYL